MSVEIIAEIGSTHEGRLDAMRRMVPVIAAAGCTTYKSQWLSDPEALCRQRQAPAYLEAYRRIAFPVDWHRTLREDCRNHGLRYLCTVYTPQDVEYLEPYVDRYKVASFEATYWPLWDALNRTRRPILVSTGMLDWAEVQAVLNRGEVIHAMLHCVSAYPTTVAEVRLARLAWLARLVDRQPRPRPVLVGFSDHTTWSGTGALAVAAGARVIEVHCRPHDTPESNPDYVVARDPLQLAGYVGKIREAEVALGAVPFIDLPFESEDLMRQYRSLVRVGT